MSNPVDDVIITGTTPSIRWVLEEINTSEIVVAYMTIKQNGQIVIEKDLSDAIVGENLLLWTLTQEETLRLATKQYAYIMCNWRRGENIRGASPTLKVMILENQKPEVI